MSQRPKITEPDQVMVNSMMVDPARVPSPTLTCKETENSHVDLLNFNQQIDRNPTWRFINSIMFIKRQVRASGMKGQLKRVF